MAVFKTREDLRRACESGNAGAQRLMAGLYLLGKGVTRDPGKAYLWLLRAGASRRDLEAVGGLLSAEARHAIELQLGMARESSLGHRAAFQALLANKWEVERRAVIPQLRAIGR